MYHRDSGPGRVTTSTPQVLEESPLNQAQGSESNLLRPALSTRQPVKPDRQIASLFVTDGLDAPAGEQFVPNADIVIHAPTNVPSSVGRRPATFWASYLPRQEFLRRPCFFMKVRRYGRRQPHAFSALAGQVWTEHQSTYTIPGNFLEYGESREEKTECNWAGLERPTNFSGSFAPVIIVPLRRPR
jgi:hypothetical protein